MRVKKNRKNEMNYQRMMHRIMLESYTLPSRRSCSGIFTQHHSTKIPENIQGVWAHKNEQLNHSYSLKPLVTAVQVYVIQGTNTANRMHESAIWWVPSRLPWRFLWHGYMEAARAGFGSWSVSQYFYLTWHCGTYTQTASSLLFFFAKPLHA